MERNSPLSAAFSKHFPFSRISFLIFPSNVKAIGRVLVLTSRARLGKERESERERERENKVRTFGTKKSMLR